LTVNLNPNYTGTSAHSALAMAGHYMGI